ncbi:MAG: hypothetical protein IT370_26070 [Deltaproteobacteria bacterium]|nr:hypothetical protein [Deltaproteobacteria bacterium]
MKRRSRWRHRGAAAVLLAGLALGLGGSSRRADGCGPEFETAFFHYQTRPDLPLGDFASGRLGVLLPSFARSYLVIAYRHLAGTGVTTAEVPGLLELWTRRLDLLEFGAGDGDAARRWTEARARLLPAQPEPGSFRAAPSSYQSYLNCHDDAFARATLTLEERVRTWGKQSPWTLDWLHAQDVVFGNCESGVALPDPAPPGAPALLRQDRAYQTAAALFYGEAFDEAAVQFDAIARDATSPWRELAPYLTARVMLRKAALAGPDALYAVAEQRLRALAADATRPALHRAAGLLLERVEASAPQLHASKLAARLAAVHPDDPSALGRWLDDYTLRLDVELSDDATVLAALHAESELTDWVLTMQEPGSLAQAHALLRWNVTRSGPWLIAALGKLDSASPPELRDQVLAAAAALPAGSPGFVHAAYHRVRMLASLGRSAEARALSDQVLATPLPRSAADLLHGQRLGLAQSLAELARHLPRQPSGVTVDETGTGARDERGKRAGPGPLFETVGARVLEQGLPLARLEQLLGDAGATLPASLRRAVAQVAWTRALLLGNDAALQRLTTALAALAPDLQSDLAGLTSADNAEQRAFAATLTILRHPGLRPSPEDGLPRRVALDELDSFRDNWWCEGVGQLQSRRPDPALPAPGEANPPAPAPLPDFLGSDDRDSLQRQRVRLRAAGSGPSFLGKQVLAFARHNPRDPRVPEALHLAVRATRYGCPDDDTSEVSCAAFRMLARKFPRSPWTGRTPYCY